MTPLASLLMFFYAGIAELPPLQNADIKVVMPDLVTILATGEWQGDTLTFDQPLEPYLEIRLLISDASEDLLLAPSGEVDADGDDILLYEDSSFSEPRSLRDLLAEQWCELVIPSR